MGLAVTFQKRNYLFRKVWWPIWAIMGPQLPKKAILMATFWNKISFFGNFDGLYKQWWVPKLPKKDILMTAFWNKISFLGKFDGWYKQQWDPQLPKKDIFDDHI